ncbi:helix-turn-helix transcriptional regulator [Streptomyces tardus]|uniref:helix-turn-helix transcriptional regulator n=1 Tax=Streptomyces tardus TaxID=2780544 RepID=UPI0027E42DDE|nr:AAA family ATPase [Streptomyces tardus]
MQASSISPVFVGRQAELSTLERALSRAGTGEPQLLVVGGEAGVGKSRLIEEFLDVVRESGAVAAVGGCIEIGAEGLPFAPVSTVLRSLHRELGEELTDAAAGQEGELARLLPELGDAAREFREEDGRARLFELSGRLLEALAQDRTLVLVIEDLHWADRSTREMLAYLLRSLHRSRLVLVATYRSDDIHRRHPLRPFLAELDRLRSVQRIELPRLSQDEVRAQIAGIQGVREPEPELVEQIFERSEGNPFFVEELATSRGDSDISDSLRDLLLVRVEALPEIAQQVVRLVAEGGSTVEYQLLAEVAEETQSELIGALRAAVEAKVLAPTEDGEGYRFRHALVREAVCDDLLPGERSALNRRYAEALASTPELVRTDQRAARLASYWYYAHDVAKALPAVLEAAVQARRRYAFAEQLRLLDRALEQWEDADWETRLDVRPPDQVGAYPVCGATDESVRYLDLLAEAAHAALMAGERKRALAVIKQAQRLLDKHDDPLRKAWFWIQRSKLMEGTGKGDGWPELSQAQDLVHGLDPSPVHAEVLAHTAAWEANHNPRADNLATAQRAVELASVVGAESVELHARLTLGGRMVDSGDITEGLEVMAEAVKRVCERGYVAILGRAHINYAGTLDHVGRYEQALEVLEDGIARAHEYGLQDTKAWLHGNRAATLCMLGRWDEVTEAIEQIRRLAQGVKPRAFAALRAGQLAVYRGDTGLASQELAEARKWYGPHDPQPQYVIPLARLELEIEAARGRVEETRAILRQAVENGFPMGMEGYGWPLLFAAASAESDLRGLPSAEPARAEVLELIEEAARRLPRLVPLSAAYGLLTDAELLRAAGKSRSDRWAEAVVALEAMPCPFPLAQARYRLAEALLGEKEGPEWRGKAARVLVDAYRVSSRLDARPLSERIEQLALRARISLAEPEHGAAEQVTESACEQEEDAVEEREKELEAFGLTRRERAVLALVAVGRTNRQIAQELFISPKTASVHVSNILSKLSVTGRGEAAAMAHRLRLLPGPAAEAPARSRSAGSPSGGASAAAPPAARAEK